MPQSPILCAVRKIPPHPQDPRPRLSSRTRRTVPPRPAPLICRPACRRSSRCTRPEWTHLFSWRSSKTHRWLTTRRRRKSFSCGIKGCLPKSFPPCCVAAASFVTAPLMRRAKNAAAPLLRRWPRLRRRLRPALRRHRPPRRRRWSFTPIRLTRFTRRQLTSPTLRIVMPRRLTTTTLAIGLTTITRIASLIIVHPITHPVMPAMDRDVTRAIPGTA